MKQLFLVGFGGALGCIFRYLSSQYISRLFSQTFPWATLIVNVLGCFIFGIIAAYLGRSTNDNSTYRLLLLVGFCGGFTTFSTFAAENIQLLHQQQYGLLAIYTLTSSLLGFVALAFGLYLFKNS